MTLKQIIKDASSRSHSEWRDAFSQSLDSGRAWVQRNGELAALVGFLAGVLIVIFFRIFVWLLFVSFVWCSILWLRTPED